jgi:L-lysine 6-transaminase
MRSPAFKARRKTLGSSATHPSNQATDSARSASPNVSRSRFSCSLCSQGTVMFLATQVGTQVIHFRQAFHGRTGYTLSLTNTFDARKTALFPKFDWPRISNPKIIFPLTEHIAEVEAAEAGALAEIVAACERHGPDIACLIIEPIQAEGGDNHFRPEFLAALRRLADERDFLLIFDEVQTGMGLTGTMWAWQGLGVEPDLFCFGKKLQACGFVANERIDEVKDNVFKISSRINSTWGGNLTDMVRATRVLEIVAADHLIDNASRMGALLLGGLHELARQFPALVSQVRGRGMMISFDLPDPETRTRTVVAARQQGLLLLPCGPCSIRFRPFLDLSRDDAGADRHVGDDDNIAEPFLP